MNFNQLVKTRRSALAIAAGALLSTGQGFNTDAAKKKRRNKKKTVKGLFWGQDSNGGQGGGSLPDFRDLFERPELWANARNEIDVFQFHHHVFTSPHLNIDDTFLREKMIPVLNSAGIKIALNVVGANWAQCENRAQNMMGEAAIIDRIQAAGGTVRFLTMQSTLSKTEGGNADTLNRCSPYPLKRRIKDIIRYMQFMQGRYPHIQFGITDSDATKGNDYQKSLRALRSALGRKGLRLDYLFLDNAAKFLENGTTEELKGFERFVEGNLKMRFGLVYTADKGRVTSNGAYKAAVLRYFNQYANAGGSPSYYLVTSWFRHPESFLPESGNTLMGTALAVGKRIR